MRTKFTHLPRLLKTANVCSVSSVETLVAEHVMNMTATPKASIKLSWFQVKKSLIL